MDYVTRKLAVNQLSPGDFVDHRLGRTITEFDDVLVAGLTCNLAPLHLDEHYSSKTVQGTRIVNGLFISAIAVSLTNADFPPKDPTAMSLDHVRHHAPTHYGDTVYAKSEVLGVTEISDHERSFALVTRVVNQRSELVLTIERTTVVDTSEEQA